MVWSLLPEADVHEKSVTSSWPTAAVHGFKFIRDLDPSVVEVTEELQERQNTVRDTYWRFTVVFQLALLLSVSG